MVSALRDETGFSLKRSSKVKAVFPSWADGVLRNWAVSAAATGFVAALMTDSRFPASSVNDTLTLMVLPSSEPVSV